MSIARHAAHYLCALLILLGLFGSSFDIAGARTSLDDAVEAAIELSELENKGQAEALYSKLHSDAQALIPMSAVVGWYEADFFPLHPQPISEIVSSRFVDWTWGVTGQIYLHTAEITFVQPFGVGANITYQQETVRLVEDGGEWRWFFGRSPEFVDEQIARFPGEFDQSSSRASRQRSTENTQTTSRSSSSGRTQRSASGCTLVELYPGYPMYRGVVTGMLANWGGLGDWACLEDLERMNPRFDIDAEDQANIAAARALGINGNPEDWLWENWMQIEAQRGLPSQCYSCVLLSPRIVPLTTTAQIDPMDPRILVGLWSGPDSYIPRSLGFIAYQARIPNAPELAEVMLDIWENQNTPGGSYFTPGDTIGQAYLVGGYTYTPPSTGIDDQQFMMRQAVIAASPYSPPFLMSAMMSMFNEGAAEWRTSRLQGGDLSLREFMVEFYGSLAGN